MISDSLKTAIQKAKNPKPIQMQSHNIGQVPGCKPHSYTAVFPCRTMSEANRRDHWRMRAIRAKMQAACVLAGMARLSIVELPATVRMVRLYKGRPMDGDNLAGAFKSIRDQIAKIYGVDDGSPLFKWEVDQEKGERGWIMVEITKRETK